MADRSIEEEIKIRAQQGKKIARYMSSTRDLVENQIEKARNQGAFNNLPGFGKPLHLEEDNPYVDPAMRMSLKILKDNDFAPYWIELGKEIDKALIDFRKETDHFKKAAAQNLSKSCPSQKKQRFDQRKALFYIESKQKLNDIALKILDYNLHCPTFRINRENIDPDDEMMKLKFEIEKHIDICLLK